MNKYYILRVMKLIALFLFGGFLSLSATTYSQTITLTGENLSIERVLGAIRNQSGYEVTAEKSLLRQCKPVTVDATGMPLKQFVARILEGQPLTYHIEGRTIILSKKPQSVGVIPEEARRPLRVETVAQQSAISGQVLDADGEPLEGAIIKIKGTSRVTKSGLNGRFTIEVGVGQALVISHIGYQEREMAITSAIITASERRPIAINLVLSENILEDVVVNAGYFSVRQREATGSISQIDAATIEKQPVTNVLQALQGRIPGVMISQNSGQPGAGISVNIRATGSLLSGTDPLYVINGVPFVSEPLYASGGNTVGSLRPSYGNSPMNMLNPSDIESISVLKDAEATALFGSRGANGVILITTKKKTVGRTGFEVNLSQGISTVAELNRAKTMTLEQYLEVRRTAFANAGVTPTATNAPDLVTWDTTQVTDWKGLLFGGTANTTDASLSISGGTEHTNFLISGTYHKEGQVIPGEYDYQRGSIYMTVGHESTDRKFGINASVNYGIDENNSSARPFQTVDLGGVAISTAPHMPLYDSTGEDLYWFNSSALGYTNPLSYTYVRYTANTNNLVGNLTLRYTPLPGLNLKASSSYNRAMLYQQNLNYSKSRNPFTGTGANPSSYFQENYTTSWNFEPQAEYSREISEGRISLMAGATFQGSSYNQPYYIFASNFSSDLLLTNYASAATYELDSFNSDYKYNSFFSRLHYSWNSRYILNANYRLDASSKFAIDKRTGSFWSVSGAWIFSSEPFVQDHLPWMSFGKLRSSYGRTGNDQIGNYRFYDTYSTSAYSYDGVTGIYPTLAPNTELRWEVNRKFEAAIDLGFFKDRIALSAAWFINRTPNPLVQYPLANISGFGSYTANMNATIQSSGPEFELNTQNIKNKNFSWNSSFNISFPQNKLAAFPDIERTGYISSRIVGESLSAIRLFHYTGIDPETSLPTFLDANEDGISNTPQTGLAFYGRGDIVTVGNSDPDFFGGFNNAFQYKGFQLDVFIQFVGRRMIPGISNSRYSPSFYVPGYSPVNMPASYYDLFQETNGKIATTQFSSTAGSPYVAATMYAQSSATISNAAFARLKNVALSYTLPSEWVKRIKMNNCIVFARAQNLFTVTDFDGYDPESAASNIPPFRTIVFGAKFSF